MQSADRFLSRQAVEEIGLRSIGRDVLIDREAAFLSPEFIDLGDRVRIDRGVLISAGPEGVSVGYNSHIAAGVLVYGGGGRVTIGPLCNLSSVTRCYTVSDDFTGDYLAGATLPERFRNVARGDVTLAPCVLVGSGALLLPGVSLGEGSVVCAHTVVSHDVAAGAVMVGHPARQIAQRNVAALRGLWREYLESIGDSRAAEVPHA
jgi:galactoside O-acetyltransferase